MRTLAMAAAAAIIAGVSVAPAAFADHIFSFSDAGSTIYAESTPSVLIQRRVVTTEPVVTRTLTQPVVIQQTQPVFVERTHTLPMVTRERLIERKRGGLINLDLPLVDLSLF